MLTCMLSHTTLAEGGLVEAEHGRFFPLSQYNPSPCLHRWQSFVQYPNFLVPLAEPILIFMGLIDDR